MSEFRFISLALCMLLGGCGHFQAHQPDAPDAPIGANRFYAVLPRSSPTMSCDDAGNAASVADQDGVSGPWDAATIENIRRNLDYR